MIVICSLTGSLTLRCGTTSTATSVYSDVAYLQIFLYTQLYFVIDRATINLMYAYYGFVLSMESLAS